jgi:CTP synthase (UTP-ammonia lyase)
VLGIADADSAEHGRDNVTHVIVPVSCEMPSRETDGPKLSGFGEVRIVPGTRLAAIMRSCESHERYFCNFEAGEPFRRKFEAAGLTISALGPAGEMRAVELSSHPFFIATLFQPQLTSAATGAAHPLILAFLKSLANPVL